MLHVHVAHGIALGGIDETPERLELPARNHPLLAAERTSSSRRGRHIPGSHFCILIGLFMLEGLLFQGPSVGPLRICRGTGMDGNDKRYWRTAISDVEESEVYIRGYGLG